MQISNLINIQSFYLLKDSLIKSLTPRQKLIFQIASIALAGLAVSYTLVACYRKLKATIFTRETNQTDGIIPHEQPLFNPQTSDSLANYAYTLFEDGMIDEAFEELKTHLESAPNDLECLSLLAELLYQDSQFDESAIFYERALDISPDDPSLLSSYGETLRMLDELDTAANVLKKSLELYPSTQEERARALASYGDILRLQDQLDEAVEVLNQCLQIEPENTFALACLGSTLYAQKKFVESITVSNQCLQIDPKDSFALGNLGRVFYAQNKFSESIAFFRESLVDYPEDSFILAYLGNAHRKQGNIQEAKQAFSKALELDEENAFALTGYGIILRLEDDLTQSLTLLAQSVASYTRNSTSADLADFVETLEEYAETLFCLNRFDEAFIQLDRALAMDSQNIRLLLESAKWSHNLGLLEQACLKLERLLDIDPNHEEANTLYLACRDSRT